MFISAKWISDFQSSRKELSNAWPQETGAILDRDKSAFQFTHTSPIWPINHKSWCSPECCRNFYRIPAKYNSAGHSVCHSEHVKCGSAPTGGLGNPPTPPAKINGSLWGMVNKWLVHILPQCFLVVNVNDDDDDKTVTKHIQNVILYFLFLPAFSPS